ncbi:MAG: hypothetical protein ACPHIC_05195 [Acidimicrobiales bacterium]
MGLVPGMRVVGEYNRLFDAELAVAMLDSAGIDATIVSDTNPETGNVSLSAGGHRVVVRAEIGEDACAVLAADPVEDIERQRHFADRPPFIRWGVYLVLAAMAGPLVVLALVEAEWLIDSLFP